MELSFDVRRIASARRGPLMRLGGGSSWKARELFERSAAVLSKLDHRGLPTLYDFGQE